MRNGIVTLAEVVRRETTDAYGGGRFNARKILALGAKLGLAALIATPLTISSAFAGTARSSSAMNLVTDGQAATILWQRAIAGGDAAESWQVGDVTVTAAAPFGSTVTVSSFGTKGGAGGAEASVTMPAIDKSGPNAAALATARYASSGRSLRSEALAVSNSATAADHLAATLISPTQTAAVIRAASIINSGCANVSGDAGSAHGTACIVQTLMQANGADWYVGDEITSSGYDSDWLWLLSGLQAWDTYGPNNTIVRYSPSSTQHPSACSTVTYSLSYNGAGISATDTLCPDRLDPKFFGSNTGFGTNWTGCSNPNYVVGAPSVDLDHNPWNASQYATVHVQIWWNCL